ncbi:MAG TPA: YigZ family protein [Flavobacterium sp.]|uniref:IMPACT family protein n=1 Tax=Flavobacterium dauae TaxID=1563479 RepID=UPI00101B3A21|nr:YigZ family protein [Flavobacterium dauae]WLD22803.1 YigZ family protein [Flavobacterium dauae]HLV51568.1 YigZ family protein [Flavobacterium sp.]
MQDTYKTINQPGEEVLFKEKNSKFFGYTFPVQSEEEAKTLLDQVKKQHFSARHWCYAYQIGTKTKTYRANDDGEPNNSAGMPIYGQIQSFDVTNILVIVVRYFGGVKLGVGGLVTAYKTAAQMALEASEIIEKTIDSHFLIRFDYRNMNKVMRVIKEKNINIVNQILELDCLIEISCRISQKDEIFNAFNQIFEVSINEKED